MSYIVYHIASTQKLKEFNSKSSAKRSATCMNRNAKGLKYSYASEHTYHNSIVTTKKVVNLMSGKEIEIPSNTPLCCDPSSETYWSM